MDKINRLLKIDRRLVEIEELRANGDLSPDADEALADEYAQLEEEFESINPAS